MRIIYLLLLIVPCLVQAQVNRSAKELASENIKEYIETKLFKDMPYKAVSYGELKTYKQPQTGKEWVLEHNFEITETRLQADKKITITKPYHFFFYLDKRIKVLGAELVENLQR
jgi:hypothetical protein